MADVTLLPKRIQDKISFNNDCWIFNGSLSHNGYGQIKVNGKTTRVHRYVYEFFNNKIPSGLVIMHKCDVRNCINPEHLSVGTPKDNAYDMIKKGRFNCGYFTGKWNNPGGKKSVLTQEQIKDIRTKYSSSFISQSEIATLYDVTQSHISRIVNNKVCIC